MAGENALKPTIRVRHSELERLSADSRFKSMCPVCKKGVLLVARTPGTLDLSREDRCFLCAQSFEYTDVEIGGEPLPPKGVALS